MVFGVFNSASTSAARARDTRAVNRRITRSGLQKTSGTPSGGFTGASNAKTQSGLIKASFDGGVTTGPRSSKKGAKEVAGLGGLFDFNYGLFDDYEAQFGAKIFDDEEQSITGSRTNPVQPSLG